MLNDRAALTGVLLVLSGQSVRVGTTQDLLDAGYDAPAVAQAGGTPRWCCATAPACSPNFGLPRSAG